MVVFTCNNCGESLQKPKVEKHFSFSCRGAKNLTCVDCFKDFRGEEYVAHTKCITENQRYGSKDYVEKAKKGEVKQESWMEMIKSILMHEPNITPGCRNLLNNICNFNNVPRKKQKFINFIKSSTGGRTSIQDIEGVWDLIEKHKSQVANENKTENLKENGNIEKRKLSEENSNELNEEQPPKKKKKKNKKENGVNEIEEVKNENGKVENNENESKLNGKSKKTKEIEHNCENLTENNLRSENFSLENEIKCIIQKKGSISLGKLLKKVLRKYKSLYGDEINENKFNKKFNKKLGKINEILVHDDVVKLKDQ